MAYSVQPWGLEQTQLLLAVDARTRFIEKAFAAQWELLCAYLLAERWNGLWSCNNYVKLGAQFYISACFVDVHHSLYTFASMGCNCLLQMPFEHLVRVYHVSTNHVTCYFTKSHEQERPSRLLICNVQCSHKFDFGIVECFVGAECCDRVHSQPIYQTSFGSSSLMLVCKWLFHAR